MSDARTLLAAAVLVLPAFVATPAASQRAWTVDPDPIAVIGEADGAEEYVLTSVPMGVVLSDGSVVIRSGYRGIGLFELRYYDRLGGHVATIGRFGQGPFEFRSPDGMFVLPGDSVLLVDNDDRFAVFGPRGERVREGRLRLEAVPDVLRAHLVDPEHLALVDNLPTRETPLQGLQEGSGSAFIIHDMTAGTVDTVAVLPARRAYYEPRDGYSVPLFLEPLTRGPQGVAGHGRLWVGRSDRPEVRGYDAEGRLATTIRLGRPPQPVTEADRTRYREEYLGDHGVRERTRVEVSIGRMDFPETLPYFGALEVDALGNLWVQRYELPWSDGLQYWDVFSPMGAPLATAALPASVVPRCARRVHTQSGCDFILAIGGDVLLLRLTDADWPRVGLYRILKH